MPIHRQQAIIWTNVDLIHWRIYVALGGIELIERNLEFPTKAYFSLQWCHMASQITSLTIVYSNIYSRHRSKKTSKLQVTGLCEGNSPVTGEFPAQGASNTENVSIWWRHHVIPAHENKWLNLHTSAWLLKELTKTDLDAVKSKFGSISIQYQSIYQLWWHHRSHVTMILIQFTD